jgi:hypothetical protein
MPNLIYRVVSACGALGYGYPRESLQAALRGRVDAIVCDAGSVDAGPYYLGTGTDYFEHDALKDDYLPMAEAGRRIGCPVVVGSCGMAGGDRNLEQMIGIAKEVFGELAIRDVKVAMISSKVDPEIVVAEYRKGALHANGGCPELREEALRDSVIVGQMGVHPLIAALQSGAQFIFAGRCCDSALFAADMIRRGIAPGLAYHVGYILESGALACEPGSPSDCLVAEIYDDGAAFFTAPNAARRCTVQSLAAHLLHQQSHPHLQFYPEGVLATERTQSISRDSRSAGIRNSHFVDAGKPWPLSIKLEGAVRLGARKVSLIHIEPAALPRVPADVLVYGRNGVQANFIAQGERELGIIVETTAATAQAAIKLAKIVTEHFAHFVFPGRKTSAGNIAYPMSPEWVAFRRGDDRFAAIVPGGTRDCAFIRHYPAIKAAIVEAISAHYPDALADADFTITEADAANPAILLRTVDPDPAQLALLHRQEVDSITKIALPENGSRLNLDAPDAYAWSLYHLLQDEDVIKDKLFPISYYHADAANWTELDGGRPRYFDIGETGYSGDLNDRTLCLIADHPPSGPLVGSRRLHDMAVTIRSKDAGVNRITFDIIFASGEDYEAALYSNAFTKGNVADVLDIAAEHVIGTYFVDACNAIKISIERSNMSASLDERDVFGTQQQSALERMTIPIYAAALSKASSF